MPSGELELHRGVLFDLDGTLADTAPDLAGALNKLRIARGEEPLPLARLRPFTSQGARGLLGEGLGITPAHPHYAELRLRFLELYSEDLCRYSCLFPGVADLLASLDELKIPWGIVTNKPQRFTLPLMDKLGVIPRASCIVSGDTSPLPKPHPHPLRLGAALLGRAPDKCIYVGDDRRDIFAGLACGMRTVAVRYGYLGNDGPIESWGAHAVLDTPDALVNELKAAGW